MDVEERPLLLATRSAGKVRELLALSEAFGWAVETLADAGVTEDAAEDALEDADTFEGNALAKARWFAARTQRVVLADDSGLAVDALSGRPGVHSKRWSGRDDLSGVLLDAENITLLQRELTAAADRGVRSRRARYVCAAACVWPGGDVVVRGETEGLILAHPRGEGGFGYDPVFFSDDLGCTFAEASLAQKAEVSHRGRAFRQLLHELSRRKDFPLTR